MQAPAPEQVAYEALIEFLYRAPIGLLQARPDGEVTMINPMSAQLLMPLVPTGDLGNLFDVLAPVAPGLRALAAIIKGDAGRAASRSTTDAFQQVLGTASMRDAAQQYVPASVSASWISARG